METRKANDENTIRALLDYFDGCHDGCMRRITFVKDRIYDDEGNLTYPAEPVRWEEIDPFKCEIEIELLLNGYPTASPRQVVAMRFEGVHSFRFFQDGSLDYSDVFEVLLRRSEADSFEFVFRAGLALLPEPVDALKIVCSGVTFTEI